MGASDFDSDGEEMDPKNVKSRGWSGMILASQPASQPASTASHGRIVTRGGGFRIPRIEARPI